MELTEQYFETKRKEYVKARAVKYDISLSQYILITEIRALQAASRHETGGGDDDGLCV